MRLGDARGPRRAQFANANLMEQVLLQWDEERTTLPALLGGCERRFPAVADVVTEQE
jgi:hypothetical protein